MGEALHNMKRADTAPPKPMDAGRGSINSSEREGRLFMIWLLVSIVLLIVLIYLKIDILIVAPVVSVLLCLVSGLDIPTAMADGFMVNFTTFAKNNFLIFVTSAMFARAMQDSGMAASIAKTISQKLGSRFAILCVFLVTALLTFGGVSLFVVVFVIYPIALQLFKEANITRTIIPGAIAAGAFTWAGFCLPGSPQAGPIIATQYLGTELSTTPVLGIICAIFMCVMQILFFNWLAKDARNKGLGFETDAEIETMIARQDTIHLPNFILSMLPIIVVLVTVNFSGLPVYYCMIFGLALSMGFGWKNIPDKLATLNTGAASSIMALMNTCAANGFGGVAQKTQGFADLVVFLTESDSLPPLVSLGLAATFLAGACGSGSGGLGIALSTMGEAYLNMGIAPGILHRISTVACIGLDSLPHNGAVVTLLKYTGIRHNDGYFAIGITTVVMPLITLALMILLASLGITF